MIKDSRDINDCHKDLIKVFIYAKAMFESKYSDLKLICTCSTRSNETQAKLYSSGRSIKGKILTKAAPGFSPHNYGLAFDCAVIQGKMAVWDVKYYREIARLILNKYNFITWGGDFSFQDNVHFELTNWKKLIK